MNNNTEERVVNEFYKNFIIYNRLRFKKAVSISEVSSEDRILDFGCATGELRKYLPKTIKYSGYDKNDKFSTIKDWETGTFDIVFALDVFEHMTEEELEQTIKRFKDIGIKTIVAGFPYETIYINKLFNIIFNAEIDNHLTHKIGWKQISKIIYKYYDLDNTKNIFYSNLITRWKIRKE